jgi:hypothetical protein
MNWTGGHLSRGSRGGAAVSLNQRQKEHFAKVQNNLRHGTKKSSPIKWSIFGKIEVQQADQGGQSSVEPRGHRESSLPVTHDRQRYIENSYPRSHDRYPSQTCDAQQTRQPSLGPAKQDDHDDLYSATPPVRKRKHETYAAGNGVHKDEEVNFIAKKRQRLLQKGDWVGITYQRPLQMTFPSPKHGDNFGRRRKVTDGHQARYASRQPTLPPFAASTRPSPRQKRSHRGKTDVRIHIGDRVVPPGISSSTAPSKRTRGHSTPRRIRDQPHVPSSDVMLLDNDEVLRSMSQNGVNESYENLFDDQDDVISKWDPHRRSSYPPSKESADEEDYRDYQTGRDGQQVNGEDDQYAGDEYDSTQDFHIHFPMEVGIRYISERSISPIAVGTSFSSTLIKHPIPQSSKVSSILRCDSSEVANSTVAQVGKVKTVVPSSQVLENEIWETWMAPLYDEKPFPGQVDEEDVEQERSISPGNSTAPARRLTRHSARHYQMKNVEVDDETASEVDKASRMVNPSIPGSSSTADHSGRRELRCNVLRRDPEGPSKSGRFEEPMRGTENLNKKTTWTSDTHTRKAGGRPEDQMGNLGVLPNGITAAKLSLGAQPKSVEKKEEDPDAIWRKFVFGSDEMDEIGLISKRTQSLETAQNETVSSVREDHSTGASAISLTYAETQGRNTPNRSEPSRQSHTPNSQTSDNSLTYSEDESHDTSRRPIPGTHTPKSTLSKADTSSTDIPWDPPTGVVKRSDGRFEQKDRAG